MQSINFQNNNQTFYEKIENIIKRKIFDNKFFYSNSTIINLSFFSFFIVIGVLLKPIVLLTAILGLSVSIAITHSYRRLNFNKLLYEISLALSYIIFFILFIKITENQFFILLIVLVPTILYIFIRNPYSIFYQILFIVLLVSLYLFTNYFNFITDYKLFLLSVATFILQIFFIYFLKRNILEYVDNLNKTAEKDQLDLNINIHIIEFALHQLRTSMNNISVYNEFSNTNSNIIEIEKLKKQSVEIMNSTLNLIESITRKKQNKHSKLASFSFLTKFTTYFEIIYPNLFIKNSYDTEIYFKDIEKEKNFFKTIIILIEIIKNTVQDQKIQIETSIYEKQDSIVFQLLVHNTNHINFFNNSNKIYFELLIEYLQNLVGYFDIRHDNFSNTIIEVVFDKNMIKQKDIQVEYVREFYEEPKKNSILIAEDDITNQKILSIGFQKYFENIVVVDNGEDVIKNITNTNFDLLVMDIQMPKINGIETIKKIRDIEKLTKNHLVTIGISGNTLAYSREELIKLGFDDFFVKPFKIKDIYKSFINLKNS